MSASKASGASLVESFDQARADYEFGKESQYMRRRTGLALNGAAEDYHFRSETEYLKGVEKARDFDRNDSIVSALVDRSVSNVVGKGFTPQPKTGDKGVDRELLARWQEWSDDPELCDIAGESSWPDMETAGFRSMVVDGDDFFLPTEEDSLQLVENHLCRTPAGNTKAVLGIELDGYRKPLRYHFARDAQGLLGTTQRETVPYEARDAQGRRQVFHLLNRRRPTMARGVTAFRPIFVSLAFYEDINFAKLLQQQIVSCFAIFRSREKDVSPGPPEATGEQTVEQDGAETKVIEGLGPGTMITGRPGEKLEGFSPNTPNTEYFSHIEQILTVVSVNLGLPLMIALMQPQGSYSAYRGALQQAQMGWERNQLALIRRLHKPVWWWRVDRWADVDPFLGKARARLGSRYYDHVWARPAWPYIDPMVDAQSALLRQANGLDSPRRLHAERGGSWKQNVRECIEDNAYAIRNAKRVADKINADYPNDPNKVGWRELIALPTATGQSISLTVAPSAPPPTEPTNAPPPGGPAPGGARR